MAAKKSACVAEGVRATRLSGLTLLLEARAVVGRKKKLNVISKPSETFLLLGRAVWSTPTTSRSKKKNPMDSVMFYF